jgi:predicted lipoprotein with Yx(FWY)xxD motif
METPPEISIGHSLAGRVLADSHGRTLYFNEDDKPQLSKPADVSGKVGPGAEIDLRSACTKRCLESWKPLTAPLAAVASGDWSIVVREDSLRQWAFQQKPLYVHFGDVNFSDRREDRVWHAAVVEPAPPLPAWATYRPTDGGEVVADARGFTVYALVENAKDGQFGRPLAVCQAECIRTYWRPIVAAPDARPVGNWTVVKGFDGVSQWTYKGELLFTHRRDTEPGELAGTRFFTRAWHTLPRSGQIMEGMDKR